MKKTRAYIKHVLSHKRARLRLELWSKLFRPATIMIVLGQTVIRWQTTIIALGGVLVLLLCCVAFCITGLLRKGEGLSSQELYKQKLEETLASYEVLKDENEELLNEVATLAPTVEAATSDLDSLFTSKDLEAHNILSALQDKLSQKGSQQLVAQALFADLPCIWPLKGGIGHVSMDFGPQVHPITGLWYIHKGVDISNFRSGDPIVSTASGQVVTVAFTVDFGHYVIIKHKYGLYTRYAHMQRATVKKGEFVSQGQVIGTVGNSGITTGPHLHYEVHIGSNTVDPSRYLTGGKTWK